MILQSSLTTPPAVAMAGEEDHEVLREVEDSNEVISNKVNSSRVRKPNDKIKVLSDEVDKLEVEMDEVEVEAMEDQLKLLNAFSVMRIMTLSTVTSCLTSPLTSAAS